MRLQRRWLQRFGVAALVSLVVSSGGVGLSATVGPAFAQASEAIALEVETLRQSTQRWLQIDLSSQRLIAWEGNTPVYAVIVSTGKPETPTVTGVFAIQSKYRVAHMRGEDYDIPDVPWTMYFYRGYAIHGAYWHHNFGTPVSHGCVNVAVDHAEWFFNWAEVGTPVIVQE
ncbi:MAG TPA: L,D-transpeptidase [Leptolyngbyaceae cyanobacterium M65_K2018_010]|nr:L,D-transpeptidase [Leptolyngbyaceae cyanobacterium M65_K2018_010]